MTGLDRPTARPLHHSQSPYEQQQPQRRRSTIKRRRSRSPPRHGTTTTTTSTRMSSLVTLRSRRTGDLERAYAHHLQLDVHDLRQELAQLAQLRAVLEARRLTRPESPEGPLVRAIRDYYALVRDGHRPLVPAPAGGGGHGPVVLRDFCRALLDPEVIMGRFVGFASFLRIAQRYPQLLGPIRIDLRRTEVIPRDSSSDEDQDDEDGGGELTILATFDYVATLTAAALVELFPRVPEALGAWLLGRKLPGVGRAEFVFNLTTRLVVSYVIDLDLVGAFTRLLGDPARVLAVLDGACVTSEYYIGDIGEFPQRPPSTADVKAKNDAPQVRNKMSLAHLLSPLTSRNSNA